jgi:hypothetical protein
MRCALQPHPDCRCRAVDGIEVEAARPRPGALRLRYVVTGRTDGLRLPPVAAPARADDLWRHPCFEAFLRVPPGAAYTELNFAPSTCWAAYRFDGPRRGMRAAEALAQPHIEVRAEAGCYELSARLDLDPVPDFSGAPVWRLGLAVVIEKIGGGLSYWALAHPPGRPDFHHSDCFALELPLAVRP